MKLKSHLSGNFINNLVNISKLPSKEENGIEDSPERKRNDLKLS